MGDEWPQILEFALPILGFLGTLGFALLAIAMLKEVSGDGD
jgi:Trk-type K+ transport system membrane component